jgi:small-conductance mechanosensitive channel/CRP-like cAMP-binding protein
MSPESFALPIGLLIVALAAALAALLVRDTAQRRFVWATSLFIVATLLTSVEGHVLSWIGTEAGPGTRLLVHRGLGLLWWLALAIVPMPKLLTDVAGALVYIAALFIVVSVVFEQPIAGLFAASGVVAVIFGFALQNTLADVFSGIALNFEHPFHIGDWIRFDDIEGEVTEINWRATRIRTRQNYVRVIPNGAVARATIDNFSLPDRRYALFVWVGLDYSLPPDRAMAMLKASALDAACVLDSPEPQVRIEEFADSFVRYHVRCWCADFARDQENRSEVHASIWEHMRWAGLSVPFTRRVVQLHDGPFPDASRPPEVALLIDRIELFQPLAADERARLAAGAMPIGVAAGHAVVRQDDAGQSLFIVAEGMLEARRTEADGHEQTVTRFAPGDFFGEMSLLTGESRRATVIARTQALIYEIEKDDLQPILQARPELGESVARIVAARLAREDSVAARLEAARDLDEQRFARTLIGRLRGFFRL